MDNAQVVQLLALAHQAEPELYGSYIESWTDRLEREHEPFRAALHWLLDQGYGACALELAAALWRFWFLRGYTQEGRDALTAALAAPGAITPSATRAKALYGAGLLAFVQGDNAVCRQLNQESLSVARALGDREAEVTALAGLSRAALRDGDLHTVRALNEEAMDIARTTGSRRAMKLPLHMLAAVTQMQGDYEAARTLFEESLQLSQELGDRRGVGLEMTNLATVEQRLGHLDRATALLRESLAIASELRSLRDIPYGVLGLGAIAASAGEPERAARLLGASQALFERDGVVMDPDDRQKFDESVARVRTALDDLAFNAAWEQGQTMSLAQAVEYALDKPATP